jgi:uncharacterized damage-inducible protein DinB
LFSCLTVIECLNPEKLMTFRFQRSVFAVQILVLLLMTGVEVLAQSSSASVKPTAGQNAQLAREIEHNWKRAKKWTLDYIDAAPDSMIEFKPTPEIRSFAEQMLHLSFWNYTIVDMVGGAKSPYGKDEKVIEKREDLKTKAALRKTVEGSYDVAIAAVSGMDNAKLLESVSLFGTSMSRLNALAAALDHQSHHRGQTTIYLRLKGVKPPPEP